MTVTLFCGDCLAIMPTLPDHCADMILADLPYGTTACKWDTVIPFEPLWAQYKRIIKPRGAIVLFGSQPFTSALVMSNPEWFRYCWVWDKKLAGNGILANVQPLKIHEDVCVFSRNGHTYNPQNVTGRGRWKGGIKDKHGTFNNAESPLVWSNEYHPVSIMEFSGAAMRNSRVHPTQKPVALCEYLIRTYTNEGETVLDNVCGSGTTLVACINTGRNGIGIEQDAGYFAIAQRRVNEAQQQIAMPLEVAACQS
ncbi:MAG: site-specific DNA-methyltransferase [Parcubacteria group bacterium]